MSSMDHHGSVIGRHQWLLPLVLLFTIFTVQSIDTSELNAICQEDSECGENSVCYDSVCQCKLGYSASSSNAIDCTLFDCVFEQNCTELFVGATCRDGHCGCGRGFELDPKGMKCVPDSKCHFNATCGDNSSCNVRSGECHCHLGFVHNQDVAFCVKMNCDKDEHCARWNNSVCDSSFHCDCKEGYEQNGDNLVCLPVNEDYFEQNILVILVLAPFSILFIFGLLYCCFSCFTALGCIPKRRKSNPYLNEQVLYRPILNNQAHQHNRSAQTEIELESQPNLGTENSNIRLGSRYPHSHNPNYNKFY